MPYATMESTRGCTCFLLFRAAVIRKVFLQFLVRAFDYALLANVSDGIRMDQKCMMRMFGT